MRAPLWSLLLLLALLPAGCATEKQIEQENRGRTAAYTVDARDLFEEYRTNQIKADEKYKGQVIVVTGTVANVAKEVTGTPYIMLSASDIGSGVQCFFAPDRQKQLDGLKGEVSIRGKCQGLDQSVILRGCTLR